MDDGLVNYAPARILDDTGSANGPPARWTNASNGGPPRSRIFWRCPRQSRMSCWMRSVRRTSRALISLRTVKSTDKIGASHDVNGLTVGQSCSPTITTDQ
jgi:hypothetical protein